MVMPTFHETWFDEGCQAALVAFVKHVDFWKVEGRIVEIGSWEGRSTLALANATSRPVHCVDHWGGSPSDVSYGIAHDRDVYATWRANVDEATSGNVVEHRMDWREFRAADDSPIAMLFLDADHSYEETDAQLREFLPLMTKGAIVCGDDFDFPGVHRATTERFGHVNHLTRVWWVMI